MPDNTDPFDSTTEKKETAKSNYGNSSMVGAISVHILGAVVNPGTFYLKPSSRVVEALQMAGGLSRQGSQTRVELRRGKTVTTVNLFKLQRSGDLAFNPFVQENDVIFVPLKKASISTDGSFRTPGVYEIDPGGTSLMEAVDLSQGFSVGNSTELPLVVIRYDAAGTKQVFKIPATEAELKSFHLIDGDSVFAPHKFTAKNKFDFSVKELPSDSIGYPSYSKDVFVVGGVKAPGRFPYVPQHAIGKYVAMAGGNSRLGRQTGLIIRSNGEKERTNIESDIVINPGDTLIVDEDILGPEFWITLMTTLAGLAVSSYAILGRN